MGRNYAPHRLFHLNYICDCLCGNAHRAGDAFNADRTTNDRDSIKAGTTFEELARKFLCKAGMPAFSPESEYFFAPFKFFKTADGAKHPYPYEVVIRGIVAGQFAENRAGDIARERQERFKALMEEKLSPNEWQAYAEELKSMHK